MISHVDNNISFTKSGFSNKNTLYSSGYNILGYNENVTPSLDCNENDRFTVSNDKGNLSLGSKAIGTLTADEIAFAGSANYLNRNYNFYLINNYAKGGSKEICFWSLSPGSFSAEKATAFYLNSYGSLQTNDVSKTSNNVQSIGYSRPAITLKSGTVITGGNGTQLEPYEVG